jgi:hypothetical protein
VQKFIDLNFGATCLNFAATYLNFGAKVCKPSLFDRDRGGVGSTGHGGTFQPRCGQKKLSHPFDLILMAFITENSSLEPLLEGLLAQIHIDLS